MIKISKLLAAATLLISFGVHAENPAPQPTPEELAALAAAQQAAAAQAEAIRNQQNRS